MKAIVKNLSQIAKEISGQYASCPGVVGIIWIGSASFGVIDQYSDIDVRLLVEQSEKSFPMKQFQVEGVKIEVEEMNLGWLLEGDLINDERYWIREKAVILHDPNGTVGRRFKEKNKMIQQSYNTQLWTTFKEIMMDYEIEKSIKRNDKSTATLYLNKTVDMVVDFLLLYYNQLVPPFKWRMRFLENTESIPRTALEYVVAMLDDSRSFDEKFTVMRKLQNISGELMLKKGYNKKQIAEYWRY